METYQRLNDQMARLIRADGWRVTGDSGTERILIRFIRSCGHLDRDDVVLLMVNGDAGAVRRVGAAVTLLAVGSVESVVDAVLGWPT